MISVANDCPAVLFVIFNRPQVTTRVFSAIRTARPRRLYVAADGPRIARAGDTARCAEARKIATSVDWPCEVRTLFRDENVGAGRGVSSAIDWFFSHEAEGIILEDDCLPNSEFFKFCQHFLERHRDDRRVMSISGSSFHRPQRTSSAYCYTYYADMWGWATWKRAWKQYDFNMEDFPRDLNQLRHAFKDRLASYYYWKDHLERTLKGEFDCWDYQWIWRVIHDEGLVVTPHFNMVSNIGFSADATHCLSEDSSLANRPTEPMPDLTKKKVRSIRNLRYEKKMEAFRLGILHKPLIARIHDRVARELLRLTRA